MPSKGFKSVGRKASIPDDLVEAIDKLLKDKTFIQEMRKQGHTRISRALAFRIALIELLRSRKILETS